MNKRIFPVLLALLTSAAAYAQKSNKVENVIIVSIDGLRWHEVFQGAEKALIKNKKYNSQDSVQRIKKILG